ncbi:MAG: alkaline phosphatase D family protein, partial [Verrucomicrobia bacterium]|nr:alkaline phosphatase D family protein [Cytophagales bacterium]
MKKIYLLTYFLLVSLCLQTFAQQSPNRVSRETEVNALPFDPQHKPFYHGVASGDPLADKVIIWTRVTPDQDQTISVTYTVATDVAFNNIVSSGTVTTDLNKDYTVKVDVSGLQANTVYYYSFFALGRRSMIGKTRTATTGNSLNEVLKFAVVSCANYEGGFFSAFSRIADRKDLNAVIHLGDYLYEYAPGTYKNAGITDTSRKNEPAKEIITKADYRTRYSLYRLDKDLQKAHQQHAFITIWDDHESTNDSYKDGAENHQANEGNWEERKNIAKEIYYEWMPIRGTHTTTKLYRNNSYGSLLDLTLLDTRLEGRVEPPANFDTPDDPANPRQMLGQEQYNWFTTQLKNSTARWRVIGNQIIFSNTNLGFAATTPTGSPAPTDINAIRGVENLFIDNWESYPV